VYTFGLDQTPIDVEWLPAGHLPSVDEIHTRLMELGINGRSLSFTDAMTGQNYSHLTLHQSVLSDEATLQLVHMLPRLRSIVLYQTLIGDTFLNGLQDVKQLRSLSLNAPRVTGAGLQKLITLTNLRELVLEDLPISDADIPHLAMLKQLRSLSLRNTRISDEGLEQLRQALPNCNVDR
jgi:hypothetical protein